MNKLMAYINKNTPSDVTRKDRLLDLWEQGIADLRRNAGGMLAATHQALDEEGLVLRITFDSVPAAVASYFTLLAALTKGTAKLDHLKTHFPFLVFKNESVIEVDYA
jgi:hypothetical protein